MKKIYSLGVLGALAGVFLLASAASAINLPETMEFDLDNWTRLYIDDTTLFPATGPSLPSDFIGLTSRAFITLNDISPTVGPGGADLPATWVAGATDGTYLHGWEDNVEIFNAVTQGDGSINLYFTHDADPTNWEFEIYQNEITTLDFIYDDPSFLSAGPTAFNAIQTALATDASSVPFARGNFADSVYFDPALVNGVADPGELADGFVLAVASINVPGVVVGGEWVNQINLPYGLGVNAFVDIDQTWGIGDQFQENFYGFGVADYSQQIADGLPIFDNTSAGFFYDMAIQNVRLNSEIGGGIMTLDGEGWIISDDGIRAGSRIPEPATMLLLGTGLAGLAGGARRRRSKKQA